jgi:protein phosphatase
MSFSITMQTQGNITTSQSTNLYCAGLSHTGQVRSVNEDAMGIFEVTHGTLLVLCDGMGGHIGGAMAASMGVSIIS